jgi:dihydroxy-acid dehydratase
VLDRFDEIAREVPVLANVRPSGKYLMEDFYYAGGLLGLMSRLKPLLDVDCLTVTGRTLGQGIGNAGVYNDDVIHSLEEPVSKEACAILRGNLAPEGAVMKPSAADPRFLRHRGPALVFEDYNHMAASIDREDLDVTPDHVIVLKNAGPVGGPGMPEWGMLPIPTKLLKQGVRDMLRISDARMSGTSYGACILHVSPESAVGGPLAFLQTGDIIELDVAGRRLDAVIPDDELARRKAAWQPKPAPARGYEKMFAAHIRQAHEGCDFDYLEGAEVMVEPEIH